MATAAVVDNEITKAAGTSDNSTFKLYWSHPLPSWAHGQPVKQIQVVNGVVVLYVHCAVQTKKHKRRVKSYLQKRSPAYGHLPDCMQGVAVVSGNRGILYSDSTLSMPKDEDLKIGKKIPTQSSFSYEEFEKMYNNSKDLTVIISRDQNGNETLVTYNRQFGVTNSDQEESDSENPEANSELQKTEIKNQHKSERSSRKDETWNREKHLQAIARDVIEDISVQDLLENLKSTAKQAMTEVLVECFVHEENVKGFNEAVQKIIEEKAKKAAEEVAEEALLDSVNQALKITRESDMELQFELELDTIPPPTKKQDK